MEQPAGDSRGAGADEVGSEAEEGGPKGHLCFSRK